MFRLKPLLLLALALYGLTVAVFWVTSVRTLTLYAVKDSYGWESFPNANNGGSDNFAITSSTSGAKNMRGWLEFNTTKIPTDDWIMNAKVRLRVWHKTTDDQNSQEPTTDSTGRVYGVYRITQPWGEYNVTWGNQPNYTEDHHATAAVPPGQGGWEGPLLYMDWDVTDIVKDWLSGAPNYGVMVRDTQENAPIYVSTQFFTHDKVPNETYYPRLIVTYVSPITLIVLTGGVIVETALILGVSRRLSRHSDDSARKRF